jgi:hypothetical protein
MLRRLFSYYLRHCRSRDTSGDEHMKASKLFRAVLLAGTSLSALSFAPKLMAASTSQGAAFVQIAKIPGGGRSDTTGQEHSGISGTYGNQGQGYGPNRGNAGGPVIGDNCTGDCSGDLSAP